MNPQLAAALLRAKQTGQPVTVNFGTYTLVANPDGSVGPPRNPMGGGTAGWTPQQQPTQPAAPSYTDPNTLQSFSPTPGSTAINASGPGYGTSATIPTVVVTAPHYQAPLNQANPNTTYVSPNTSQPTGTAPVVGQTDTPSGPSVHATYNYPQPPPVAVSAQRYRQAHGMATAADNSADALNAQSLAAAQAGRTYFNPALLQQGQPVLNALVMPPAATQPSRVANANNQLQQQQQQAASG